MRDDVANAAAMRRAPTLAVLVAILLPSCAPSPSVPTGATDAGRDGAPDAGPSRSPVLPAQTWELTVTVEELSMRPRYAPLTIHLEARAASGTVRAVAGGNGRSSHVAFESALGVLRAMGPVDVGTDLVASVCAPPAIRIDGLVLRFRDDDGDGIEETLASAEGAVSSLSESGATAPYGALVATVAPDTAPPRFALYPSSRPAGDAEVLWLFASEPVDGAARPYLVSGARRFPLREQEGSYAPASWSIALADLPEGAGYVLAFDDDPRDLAGHVADAIDLRPIDVAPLRDVMPGGFESNDEGVAAEGGVRTLSGRELAIEGERSVLGTGTVVVRVPTTFATTEVVLRVRMHADRTADFRPWARVLAPDGTQLTRQPLPFVTSTRDMLDGYGFRSGGSLVELSIPVSRSPYVLVVIDPHVDERGCTSRWPGNEVGFAIDSVQTR